MKKALFFSTLTVAVFIFSSLRKPTGPANAYYSIKPIGYSDNGIVLCSTTSYFNGSGAQVMMPETYGYLLVSAKGLWKETDYRTLTEADGQDSITRFKEKFEADIDLKTPPAHLKEMITAYHIQHKVDTLSRGQYHWSAKGIYNTKNKLVSSFNQQRSVGDLKSKVNSGTQINCSYAIKGVLFFENATDDERHEGAVFEMTDDYDASVDFYSVTGICLLKPKAGAK